jgi:hypothetical protein
VRALRSASNSFKGILAITTTEHNKTDNNNKGTNESALSRFMLPSRVLKRAQAKQTQKQERRFRSQWLQHYQSNQNRNRKGEQAQEQLMTSGYPFRFTPAAEPPVVLSALPQCGVLNRAKVPKTMKMKKHSADHQHAQACRSGAQNGRSGSYSAISSGRDLKTSGLAAARTSPRRPRNRVNGADIYVVRTTKKGLGNAKPCWRCLEWCRWAGVRRIFYWDASAGEDDNDEGGDEQLSSTECSSDSASVGSTDAWEKLRGRWEVVKVNSCRVEDCYVTSTDGRILCGEVSIDWPSWVVGLARLTVRRFNKR